MKDSAPLWRTLGCEPTASVPAIRRAYAAALKRIDSEKDAHAFIELRGALDAALALARLGQPAEEEHGEAPPQEADGRFEPPADRETLDEQVDRPDPAPRARRVDRGTAAESEREFEGEVLEEVSLDAAPFEAIDAILLGRADDDQEALEALTERILADPAMERLNVANWVEAYMAERIATFVPRSDPMIEPAIAFFHWDRGAADLRRPPAIDWILQRREDRIFENDLARAPGLYDAVLQSLRRPVAPMSRFAAWWRGVRVEYLLAYLQSLRPTVLRGLDQDSVRWWSEHIAAQQDAGFVARYVRNWRRNEVWARGLVDFQHSLTPALFWGIFLFPWLFAWAVLRPGYNRGERGLAFGWLGLMTFVMVLGQVEGPPPKSGLPPIVVSAPAETYTWPADDVDRVLERVSQHRLDMTMLFDGNPALHRDLLEVWKRARDRGAPWDDFYRDVKSKIDSAYRRGLHQGGYRLQKDHWQIVLDKARWVRSNRPGYCEALQAGRVPVRTDFPTALEERDSAILARAVLASRGEGSPPGTGRFMVPGAIVEAALKRSGLGPDDFRRALRGDGTPGQRCAVNEALIAAALALPRKQAQPFLKNMTNAE